MRRWSRQSGRQVDCDASLAPSSEWEVLAGDVEPADQLNAAEMPQAEHDQEVIRLQIALQEQERAHALEIRRLHMVIQGLENRCDDLRHAMSAPRSAPGAVRSVAVQTERPEPQPPAQTVRGVMPGAHVPVQPHRQGHGYIVLRAAPEVRGVYWESWDSFSVRLGLRANHLPQDLYQHRVRSLAAALEAWTGAGFELPLVVRVPAAPHA